MKLTLTRALAIFAFMLTGLFAPTLAAHAEVLAGRDYVAIDPAQPTDDPTRIEVIEFFSYACPHCNDLSPILRKWAEKLPADVDFKRVPVSFNTPFYQLMARLYYTLDALGEVRRLDATLFSSIHEKGLKLIDDKSILQWAVAQGIDAKKFSDAYNSFGVAAKTKRADALSAAAKIRGVPALVVEGRYLVGQNAKSHEDLLALTDQVVDKVRSERAAAKKK